MNYKKIYDDLIISRMSMKDGRIILRKQREYFEGHHIEPKCLGGNKSRNVNSNNIVLLTAREHFLAHWLLFLAYPNNSKIVYAFWAMCNGWIINGRKNRENYSKIKLSSRLYEEVRKSHVIKIRENRTGNHDITDSGRLSLSNRMKENNPMKNPETQRKNSESQRRNGSTITDERRKIQAQENRDRIWTIESRKKLSMAKFGVKRAPFTLEAKMNMRKARMEKYKDKREKKLSYLISGLVNFIENK